MTHVFVVRSEPSVVVNPSNDVYFSSLVFDDMSDKRLRSGIANDVSKDGGLTWSQPVFIAAGGCVPTGAKPAQTPSDDAVNQLTAGNLPVRLTSVMARLVGTQPFGTPRHLPLPSWAGWPIHPLTRRGGWAPSRLRPST